MSEEINVLETIEEAPAPDQAQQLRLVERERNVLAMQVSQRDNKIQDLERRLAQRTEELSQPRGETRIRWLSLLFGFLLLVPVPLLVGYGLTFYREQPQAWYWPLSAGLVALGLTLVGLFYLLRFLWDVGLIRGVAIAAVALVVASLGAVPFVGRGLAWADRIGAGLATVLDGIGTAVVAYGDAFLDWGGQVAHLVMRWLGS